MGDTVGDKVPRFAEPCAILRMPEEGGTATQWIKIETQQLPAVGNKWGTSGRQVLKSGRQAEKKWETSRRQLGRNRETSGIQVEQVGNKWERSGGQVVRTKERCWRFRICPFPGSFQGLTSSQLRQSRHQPLTLVPPSFLPQVRFSTRLQDVENALTSQVKLDRSTCLRLEESIATLWYVCTGRGFITSAKRKCWRDSHNRSLCIVALLGK